MRPLFRPKNSANVATKKAHGCAAVRLKSLSRFHPALTAHSSFAISTRYGGGAIY
jgi:hypothetical protein